MQLKKILIISPHFPPSNLAGVHRARLFARHLPQFGWEPVILTVHEDYYEESLDINLLALIPDKLRIEKVKALPVTRPRLIGDIGLRGFFQLYARGKQLLRQEKFDFLYIHIPSFYAALLGRLLHASTGIPYGIDYIDPWVHVFPGSEKKFSRHWWSMQLAKLLEPVAVKKAVLITGVAEGYYAGVLERNPAMRQRVVTGAMPYGAEESDHAAIDRLNIRPYLFNGQNGKIRIIYAGAMLPRAYAPLRAIFRAVAAHPESYGDVEFHFIGTGFKPDDPESFNIKPLAEEAGLWNNVVFEYPRRIPYLDVLVHLHASDAVFILGSTEPHYTPSKTYQGVLSGKPILAVLHEASTAVNVINRTGAGKVLAFKGEADVESIALKWQQFFSEFRFFLAHFNRMQVDMSVFEQYSAANGTALLASLIDKSIRN